jgi:hypothetical protein
VGRSLASGGRRRALAAALLLGCLGAGPAAAAERAAAAAAEGAPAKTLVEPLPDTWYAQALAHSDAGINVTHFWSKEDKLRAETVFLGHRIVTIVNGPTYYAYDLLTREGLAIGRSATALQQDAARARPFGNELDAVVRTGGEKVGEDVVGGTTVEVYQVTDQLGKRQVWVTPDARKLPLRIRLFRRQTGQTLQTDFLDWKRGIPVTDAFFQPEPDVALTRLSFEDYVTRQGDRESLGPVPVLYTDLLHGY